MSSENRSNEGDSRESLTSLSRRGIIGGLAGLGLLGIGANQAGASSTLPEGDTLTYGGAFTGSPSSGYALELENTATSGANFAFRGRSFSPERPTLIGVNRATSGNARGVAGISDSPDGTGLIGNARSSTGRNVGLLGITGSDQGTALQGAARNATGTTVGVRGRVESPGGVGMLANNAAATGNTAGLRAFVNSPNGYGIDTPDDARVGSNLQVEGDVVCQGKKNFAQAVETPSGSQTVYYTAVEAGKAHTEVNDVAEVTDGEAVIDLPEHFEMVTNGNEPLTVQLTPHSNEKVHPQVVEESTSRIVVKDFGDGPDDYSVSYTVKGIREGHEDPNIVR